MLDVVAGNDRDRPLGRKPALQQRLRDGRALAPAFARSVSCATTRRPALREEHAIRRGLGPMLEPLRELVGIGRRVGAASGDRWCRRACVRARTSAGPSRTARSGAPEAFGVAAPRAQPRSTFLPRFSRKSLSRALASSLLDAIRHQRLGHEAARRIALGDARQHVHDGEIGQRRVAPRRARRSRCLGSSPAPSSTTMCDRPVGLAFLGRIGAAGEHHVHHARDADQPRQPHRAAAADIDAAAALRQRVIGRALGDAHMARRRELQPAADHRAMQHRDHRHLAELDLVEHAMPHPRMLDAFGDVALGQFAEVEAGGEMLALAVEHDGLDVVRQRREEGLDAENDGVVERVALLRPRQAQDRDVAPPLGRQRGWQFGRESAFVAFGLLDAMPRLMRGPPGGGQGGLAPRTPRSAPPPSDVRHSRSRGCG